MLQDFDTSSAVAQRQGWLALLARAPLDLLEGALAGQTGNPPQWLRAPQTGLVMAQARAGGTGERFNFGEVTVTRCALRLAPGGAVGVGYVMGRSHRQAQLVAVADALLQDPVKHPQLDQRLLTPIRQFLVERRAAQQARAQATRVEFFTVARESGEPGDSNEDSE